MNFLDWCQYIRRMGLRGILMVNKEVVTAIGTWNYPSHAIGIDPVNDNEQKS